MKQTIDDWPGMEVSGYEKSLVTIRCGRDKALSLPLSARDVEWAVRHGIDGGPEYEKAVLMLDAIVSVCRDIRRSKESA